MTGTGTTNSRTKIIAATALLSTIAVSTGIFLYKRSKSSNSGSSADIHSTSSTSHATQSLQCYDANVKSLSQYYVSVFKQCHKPTIDAQQTKEMLFKAAVHSVNKMAEHHLHSAQASQLNDAVKMRYIIVSKLFQLNMLFETENTKVFESNVSILKKQRECIREYLKQYMSPSMILSTDYVFLSLVHAAYVDSKVRNANFEQVAYDYISSALTQHAYAASKLTQLSSRPKQQMANVSNKLAVNYDFMNMVINNAIAETCDGKNLEKNLELHIKHAVVANSVMHDNYLLKFFAVSLRKHKIDNARDFIREIVNEDIDIEDMLRNLEGYINTFDVREEVKYDKHYECVGMLYAHSLHILLQLDADKTYENKLVHILDKMIAFDEHARQSCMDMVADKAYNHAALEPLATQAKELASELYNMYVDHHKLKIAQILEASKPVAHKVFSMRSNEFKLGELDKLKSLLTAKKIVADADEEDAMIKDIHTACEFLDVDNRLPYLHCTPEKERDMFRLGIDVLETLTAAKLADKLIKFAHATDVGEDETED